MNVTRLLFLFTSLFAIAVADNVSAQESNPDNTNGENTGTLENTGVLENTGTLKIQFKYKSYMGEVPELKPVAVIGGAPIPDESLIVNKMNMGIQNVVVYVDSGRRGTKLPPQKPQNRIHKLDIKNCRFVPRVLITQVGDTIRTADPRKGHAIAFQLFNSGQQLGPAKDPMDILLTKTEPSVMPVKCIIHPWSGAHVLVVDHPFAAVSDEDGVLKIKGLPTGKINFRVWHETGTFKNEIFIDGQSSRWPKNKFQYEIKTGANDLGVVEIPEGEFTIDKR